MPGNWVWVNCLSNKPVKLEVKDGSKDVAFTAIVAGRLHTLALIMKASAGRKIWATGTRQYANKKAR